MTDYAARADAILAEWVTTPVLRRHCQAVAASMRHFAGHSGVDADLWYAVGLLHDMDFERHPTLGDGPDNHPFVGVAYLREQGWSDEVCRAILSHADYSGVSRDSTLEKTLFAVDELSSFVLAVAMVKPSKSIDEVEPASVRKKMKDKAFARAVHREDIIAGAAGLDMDLDALIAEVIVAITADAARLGVAGAAGG